MATIPVSGRPVSGSPLKRQREGTPVPTKPQKIVKLNTVGPTSNTADRVTRARGAGGIKTSSSNNPKSPSLVNRVSLPDPSTAPVVTNDSQNGNSSGVGVPPILPRFITQSDPAPAVSAASSAPAQNRSSSGAAPVSRPIQRPMPIQIPPVSAANAASSASARNGSSFRAVLQFPPVFVRNAASSALAQNGSSSGAGVPPIGLHSSIILPNGSRYNGRRTYIAPDNRQYDGDFQNGRAHGTGKLRYNRHVYTGEFENGKAHGWGKLSYPNGDWFEGDFENGMRHGRGKMVIPSGATYDGDYRCNVRHGKGKLFRPDGTLKYDGDFANDQAHGKGRQYNPDGSPLDPCIMIYENGVAMRPA